MYPKRSLIDKIADSKLAIHFAESKEVSPDIETTKHARYKEEQKLRRLSAK